MKRWLRLALVGLVVAGLIGTVASAGSPGPTGRQQEAARRALIFMQKLGITQEQAAQIRDLLTGPNKELERLQKAVRMARLRLALALEEEAADNRLAALIADCEAAAKPLKEFRAARIRKAFEVLALQQQAKLIVMEREDWWRIVVQARQAAR